MRLVSVIFGVAWLFILQNSAAQELKGMAGEQMDGYRAIWFELNQKYTYGDKYSGGLGTYTAKHMPIAVYAKKVDRTFFVFGGTTQEDERHLLAMVGVFDHKTGLVSKPTIVYDKLTVNDPHDNPSITIDDEGYLWILVSGRGTKRIGIKLRSKLPYSTDQFEIISEESFTYPQIWKTKFGFAHFFTKYTGVRELYFEKSTDGKVWTSDLYLAGIQENADFKSGHYQVSGYHKNGKIIGTFFNRHKDGNVDTRSDLYYVQSKDFGTTWENIQGRPSEIPLKEVDIPERVIDYASQSRNVYMKDMQYDKKGNPICLYITSGGHEPGPENAPYSWMVTFWRDNQWVTAKICESDHNYDMGSLFLDGKTWKIVAPTGGETYPWSTGGEISIWTSENSGMDWNKEMDVTKKGINMFYVRRPLHGRAPFSFFWASGAPHELSKSELFFGDFEGNVWKLPYEMDDEWEKPIRIVP